jgi:hypothetical protein
MDSFGNMKNVLHVPPCSIVGSIFAFRTSILILLLRFCPLRPPHYSLKLFAVDFEPFDSSGGEGMFPSSPRLEQGHGG